MPDIWQAMTAVASLLAVCLSLYTLLTARNHKDTADLIVTSNKHETRLAKLETEVAHLPGSDAVHDLRLSIMKMEGQLAVIVERVGPIKAIAERLQENFLEHGR